MSVDTRVHLVTAGLVHPSLVAQWNARRALSLAAERVRSRIGAPVELSFGYGVGALRAACSSRPDLLAFYLHRPRPDHTTVAALRDYVARGGSLIGLHSATACFKGDRAYHDLLGGVFARHGKIRRLRMIRCSSAPEPWESLPAEFEVTDEPYEHDFAHEVREWYRWNDRWTAAWSKEFGAGKVAYLAPGHRAAVWRSEAYRNVVCAMVEWLLAEGV